jgi:3-isopropylmalate/(R)-2-methylmalate dehydratase small subunit
VSANASRIECVSGRAVPVRGHDIDTDRIIPARFLKVVTFEGLEAHVFEDDRLGLEQAGGVHPFDNPAYAGASLLFANANFGCGSSREHAPQALRRWGIRAVVAESFAEIFFGNSMTIGLPCLTAKPADLEALMALAEGRPAEEFTVDLRRLEISGGGLKAALAMPDSARDAFLSGDWDATGLLLADYATVEATKARLPYVAGFQSGPRP